VSLSYIQYTERMVGKNHPVRADTLNRALRQLLTDSGYDPDAATVDLRNTVGNIIVVNATANPDKSIRRDSNDGFLRFQGGANAGGGGQLRVIGKDNAYSYGVDCLTPNAAAAELFRWGMGENADWVGFDIRNVNQVSIAQSGAATASTFFYGTHVTQTITAAANGAALRAGLWAECAYQGTDETDQYAVKQVGVWSTQAFGVVATNAPVGSVWNFGADLVVANQGSPRNEYACYFGAMKFANDSIGRAWFTDYNLIGPTGVQMNLAGGVTMCIKNFFNGAMASQGNTSCFAAVTRQNVSVQSGEWSGQTTYAVDFGFQVTGWAGLSGAKVAGFTVAFMAGGTGGMWNAAFDGSGNPVADALSIIGTAFEGRDMTTWGLNLHTPNVATAKGIGITGGSWHTGIDISGASFSTNGIKTGAGPNQIGDRTGIGQAPSAGAILIIRNGLNCAPSGVSQLGADVSMIGNAAATNSIDGIAVSAHTTVASYTAAEVVGLRVNPITAGAGSTITTAFGVKISNQTAGGTNYAIYTQGGLHRFHDNVNISAGVLQMQGTQIATTRRTGWGAPTGVATRSAFDTSTVTLSQLAERVKALIDDLTTHGLIGA